MLINFEETRTATDWGSLDEIVVGDFVWVQKRYSLSLMRVERVTKLHIELGINFKIRKSDNSRVRAAWNNDARIITSEMAAETINREKKDKLRRNLLEYIRGANYSLLSTEKLEFIHDYVKKQMQNL